MPKAAFLAELLEKYEEIARLRDRSEPASDPRPALVALSARFPGALKELDEVPPDVLRDVLSELRETELPAARLLVYRTMYDYHAALRGALEVKRWLRGAREVSPELATAFASSPALSAEAAQWASELPRIARPPRGRLTDLVVERIARSTGEPAETVRQRVSAHRRGARGS